MMTLLDVLKMIERDFFPLTEDEHGNLDTRPQSGFEVTIRFMHEEETGLTCNIQNEILVPWYDCDVKSIQPGDESRIEIWLKDKEYLKKKYSHHVIPYVKERASNDSV